jgi:hypothetical protein
VKRRVSTRESEAPAEPPNAGPRVSDCQRFYGAAGIGAALAAGMRLSRSFALPAPTPARKSTPLATRHWATQSVHLLTACLTRMQLLRPITPLPVANPGSSFGSSLGTGPNISHHAAGPLQSQSAAGLPAASM